MGDNHVNRWLVPLLLFNMTLPTFAADVPFAEDFALARDRAVVLKQLIPGTEEYYYYHALHALNSEQFEKLDTYLKPWLERHGESPRYREIVTRHVLLTYERDPKKTLAYVRERLGLAFDHQKESLGAAPNLPTRLDAKLISRELLRQQSFAQGNLQNFEDRTLETIATEPMTWELRRNFLQRLIRPDVPNLVSLIDADLKAPHSQAFGSLPIHARLTLAQLDELLTKHPSLLNQQSFVFTYLTKQHPGADTDWKTKRELTQAYLERQTRFVDRLDPVHNSLNAHLLYHRLAFDLAGGVPNRTRFLAYLQLPRQQGYMSQQMLENPNLRHPADLNTNFNNATLLPPVLADEPLVRAFLKHFLKDAPSPKDFEPYINDVYLKHLFAETKAEHDLGDAEQWASMLPPDVFRSLRERIDIDFAATNKTEFGVSEPVKLDLHIKNVPNLIVKVFEINTNNFYRTQQRELDTDITLDGLVPNREQSFTYTEPPLRRVARSFEFPELNKPGVYIIDFIGAGKSSRALIRKGRLRPLVNSSSVGQLVRVIDATNTPVPTATLWLGGIEYTPTKEGVIVVPFSTAPGRRPIVLRDGEFASLDYLDHQGENYTLTAGIHLDRESLLTQRLASVLVRPGLFVNGHPISVKALENVKLSITATNQDGTTTALDAREFHSRAGAHDHHRRAIARHGQSAEYGPNDHARGESDVSIESDRSVGQNRSVAPREVWQRLRAGVTRPQRRTTCGAAGACGTEASRVSAADHGHAEERSGWAHRARPARVDRLRDRDKPERRGAVVGARREFAE
jgi:hypothetical protein